MYFLLCSRCIYFLKRNIYIAYKKNILDLLCDFRNYFFYRFRFFHLFYVIREDVTTSLSSHTQVYDDFFSNFFFFDRIDFLIFLIFFNFFNFFNFLNFKIFDFLKSILYDISYMFHRSIFHAEHDAHICFLIRALYKKIFF